MSGATGKFRRDGVSFQYPTNWSLELHEEDDDSGWAAMVQSPETAFAAITYAAERPDPTALVTEAGAALLADYPELESEPARGRLGSLDAAGFDHHFLTLDVAVTAWSRAAAVGGGSLMAFAQVSEHDRAKNEVVLHAIIASVQVAAK